jgi:uncharacterized protein
VSNSAIPQDISAAKYISLVTFKRDGTRVPTPVWFAADGDHLYAYSNASAGKVKRARNSSRCEIAACDRRGKALGTFHRGSVTIVEPARAGQIDSLLAKRYGWQKRLVDASSSFGGFLRRRKSVTAHLEISMNSLTVQSCWT